MIVQIDVSTPRTAPSVPIPSTSRTRPSCTTPRGPSRGQLWRQPPGEEGAEREWDERRAGVERARPERTLQVERQHEQQPELAERDDQRRTVPRVKL